jgi:hypothetical protein
MTGPGKFPRGGASILAAVFLVFYAMIPSGCLAPEPDENSYLRFQNPELTAGFDSLQVLGVNARKGDTLAIRRWRKGEDFPSQAAYPPGLEAAFTLLVRGYIGEALVYQSRTAVAGGKAQAQVRDFLLAAPALPGLPISRTARVGDVLELDPVWETRPGTYRQPDSGGPETYTPEAVFAWTRAGQVLGRDSVLTLGALTLADSGTYLFSAENRAGRDSLEFRLTVKHMLPKITDIKPQAALPGKALTVRPVIARSDSLLFRWMKDGLVVSTDTALVFPALGAADTGAYQLAVANASDTSETDVSNRFAVSFAPDPNAAWKAEASITAGAQDNSSHGTALDLDAGRAMLYSEAAQKQPLIDLLLVYSGGSLKFMSAVAAKHAGDLTYADGFDDAKIKDVKLVKAASKPASPADGRTAFNAGSPVNSIGIAAGQGFLVKTTDGNLAWLKIESIQGGSAAAASAQLTVALAPF